MTGEQVRTTTVRLPEALFIDAELVAQLDDVTFTRMVNDAVQKHVTERRADPVFKERLRQRIRADQRLLKRIDGQP